VNDRTYTIPLSDVERQTLIFCMSAVVGGNLRTETTLLPGPEKFGALYTKLIDAQPDRPAIPGSLSSGSRPSENSSLGSPQNRATAGVEGRAAPPPIELRDRWARNRKGEEVPNPEGCERLEVELWKTELKKPRKPGGDDYMQVTWQNTGVGYSDANCFDKLLFPWLANRVRQKTVLHVVKNGKYLNVVGVRA
jgi:hypothetical protein